MRPLERGLHGCSDHRSQLLFRSHGPVWMFRPDSPSDQIHLELQTRTDAGHRATRGNRQRVETRGRNGTGPIVFGTRFARGIVSGWDGGWGGRQAGRGVDNLVHPAEARAAVTLGPGDCPTRPVPVDCGLKTIPYEMIPVLSVLLVNSSPY